MVEINHLRDIGQRAVAGLESRVVATGSPVQQQDSGNLAHRGAIGAKLGALDVEEQLDIANLDAHGTLPPDVEGFGNDARIAHGSRARKFTSVAIEIAPRWVRLVYFEDRPQKCSA